MDSRQLDGDARHQDRPDAAPHRSSRRELLKAGEAGGLALGAVYLRPTMETVHLASQTTPSGGPGAGGDPGHGHGHGDERGHGH
jgi:hypothetical protein